MNPPAHHRLSRSVARMCDVHEGGTAAVILRGTTKIKSIPAVWPASSRLGGGKGNRSPRDRSQGSGVGEGSVARDTGATVDEHGAPVGAARHFRPAHDHARPGDQELIPIR